MISLLLLAALGADPGALLPLDEALRQAVAHQPALLSARYRRETAAAQVTQAKSLDYPQVHAEAEVFAASDNGAATAYLSPPDFVRVGTRPAYDAHVNDATPFASSLAGVGAHYDVLDFGYSRGIVGAAEAQLDARVQSEKQTLQDVLLRTTTAYFAALAAQQTLELAQSAQKRATEHDQYAEAGVKSGLKPPIDLPRSRAELQAARVAVIRAANSLAIARSSLDTAIGWVPPGSYVLQSPPEDTRAVPEPNVVSDQALGARFDLAALRAEERSIEQQRVAAYSGHFPRLVATGALDARGFDGLPTTLNYDVGLVLDLPLFTGFLVTGQVQEAEARLSEVRAREAGLRDAIDYQLRQSRGTLLSAQEAIAASQAQVDAAKAGLDQAETRYRQGLGNIIELTDAEVQLEVAQSGLVQSRFDANVSRAQLDYAVGALKAP